MAKARVIGPRMEVEAAKALVDSGQAVILDVVATHVWPSMARRIAGSIRIPPEEIQARQGELPRDKIILAYCT
jgi:rhodanese-related sulfurtransferase